MPERDTHAHRRAHAFVDRCFSGSFFFLLGVHGPSRPSCLPLECGLICSIIDSALRSVCSSLCIMECKSRIVPVVVVRLFCVCGSLSQVKCAKLLVYVYVLLLSCASCCCSFLGECMTLALCFSKLERESGRISRNSFRTSLCGAWRGVKAGMGKRITMQA